MIYRRKPLPTYTASLKHLKTGILMEVQNMYHSAYGINDVVEFVKDSVKRYFSRATPGLFEVLDIYCLNKYGKHIYQLFVESPCRFYKVLMELYKDESSANIILKIVIKSLINNPKLVEDMSNYVKNCRDAMFIEILKKIITDTK